MKAIFSKCTEAIEYTNNTKTFGCFYSEKNDTNDNIHIHECCEILFCIKGSGTLLVDDRIYNVSDGNIFVMNQFEAHKITYLDDSLFTRFALQIHPSFLYNYSSVETDLAYCFTKRGGNITNKISLSPEQSAKLLSLFDKLSQYSDFGDDISKAITVIEIIILVNSLFTKKNEGYIYHSKIKNETLNTAIEYINNNLDSTLTLESIAKKCFVSVNILCRVFKQYMGTTVKKYIISQRITRAKKLLIENTSVSEVAEKCGFSDYTSFIRAFKTIVGISPGQYKNHID